MLLVTDLISALVNLVLLAGIPFLVYFAYQKWRRHRPFVEIAHRAGLCPCEVRYVAYSAAFALVVIALLVLFPPPLEPLIREGSAWRAFVDRGLSGQAVVMALLYGVVKTGFPEELLFRGLIAGSLSRRLPLVWANLVQALIFLLPHLLLLWIMPEMWWFPVPVFAFALFVGWLRIKSGSIIGPWLIHASLNVAMCLSVAVRTAA